ncbi:MAG: hypothetical protein LQ346_005320 [Caloplaca aetnensis]|nr:MAG: hypothetical protein LQ346_005320 [Caloplaca aetnensis]
MSETHNIALALPPSRPLTTLLDIPTDHLVNLTAKSNVHCTTDATWKSPSFHDPRKYLHSCKEAARLARKDLWFDGHYELEEKYEFLDQHSTPQTTGPQIRLPKIYTASECLFPPSSLEILFRVGGSGGINEL